MLVTPNVVVGLPRAPLNVMALVVIGMGGPGDEAEIVIGPTGPESVSGLLNTVSLMSSGNWLVVIGSMLIEPMLPVMGISMGRFACRLTGMPETLSGLARLIRP